MILRHNSLSQFHIKKTNGIEQPNAPNLPIAGRQDHLQTKPTSQAQPTSKNGTVASFNELQKFTN
jgi:hypothetical protein